MRCIAIALGLFLFLQSSFPSAAILRVPGQYADIESALGSALPGDSILVAGGIYDGPYLSGPQNIAIISESGREYTTLSYTAFFGCTGYTLKGFRIEGGITIEQSTDISIMECDVCNSSEGIYVFDSRDYHVIRIENNLIHDNSQKGIMGWAADYTIRGNHVYNNGGNGIEIFEPYQTPASEIEDNLVYDNLGEGIYLHSSHATLVTRNVIHSNGAGGLHIRGTSYVGVQEIVNNTICGNTSYGIRLEPWPNWTMATNIQKNVIAKNSYAGILVEENSNPAFACNDVWDNSNFANGNYVGFITDQTGFSGNISVDPYFCNPAARDYSLASNSLALLASCGPMGAIPTPGCSNQTAVEQVTWGAIKSMYK